MHSGPRPWHRAGCALGLATLLGTSSATAQSRLAERRSDGYYAAHGSAAGATVVGALILDGLLTPAGSPGIDDWFTFEEHVHHYYSATASGWSDRLLFASIVMPMTAHVGDGVDRQLTNHTVVYVEAHGVHLLLHVLTKHAVRRARPYTHEHRPGGRRRGDPQANLSFFSGHSGAAFVSAVSGSYLFGDKSDDPWARRITWGAEMAAATATAHLRVRAGMHYYSDVLAGALVGSGIGIAVPYFHGNRHHPDRGEYIAAGIGFALGAVWPLFLGGRPPSDDDGAQRDPQRTNRRASGADDDERSIAILPLAGPGSFGLSAVGVW